METKETYYMHVHTGQYKVEMTGSATILSKTRAKKLDTEPQTIIYVPTILWSR